MLTYTYWRRNLIILVLICFGLSGYNRLSGQDYTSANTSREVIINYPDSLVKADILVLNPEIDLDNAKMYTWYNAGKIKTNQGGFTGNLMHGDYRVFSLKNDLLAFGSYQYGLKEGVWKKWNSNGHLDYIKHYKKGLLDGTVQLFDYSGNLIKTVEYYNGVKDGEMKYYQNGNLTQTEYYKDGVLQVASKDSDNRNRNKKFSLRNLFLSKDAAEVKNSSTQP